MWWVFNRSRVLTGSNIQRENKTLVWIILRLCSLHKYGSVTACSQASGGPYAGSDNGGKSPLADECAVETWA